MGCCNEYGFILYSRFIFISNAGIIKISFYSIQILERNKDEWKKNYSASLCIFHSIYSFYFIFYFLLFHKYYKMEFFFLSNKFFFFLINSSCFVCFSFISMDCFHFYHYFIIVCYFNIDWFLNINITSCTCIFFFFLYIFFLFCFLAFTLKLFTLLF